MTTQKSGSYARPGWRRALLCASAGVALVVLSSSRWGSVAGADSTSAVAPTSTVVVAADDFPSGSVMDSRMLSTANLPTDVAAGLATDSATLVGRVLVVPVVRGEPIAFGMTTPRAAPQAGHRLVRVSVGAADVAPDVRVGADADLVASFAPASTDSRPTVTVVATARVAALDKQPDASPAQTPDTAPFSTSPSQLGATLAVTLDCAAGDALRILWARDNARILRLLAHVPGDAISPSYG